MDSRTSILRRTIAIDPISFFSLVNFWTIVFPLPKACLDKLEEILSVFLWSGAPNSVRGAKVALESVCTPKNVGGLGLRRL